MTKNVVAQIQVVGLVAHWLILPHSALVRSSLNTLHVHIVDYAFNHLTDSQRCQFSFQGSEYARVHHLKTGEERLSV